MSLEFDLTLKRLRRKEKRDFHLVLTGKAGPYGEVTVTVGRTTKRADLSSATLPPAWVTDPDMDREGLVPLGKRSCLVVGDEQAELTQNRRALNKEDRALHIKLGDRRYSYLAIKRNVEELRGADQEPLVRVRVIRGGRKISVLTETDPIDLALGLILQGADLRGLTITRTVLFNVLDFLDTGKGEA